MTPLHTEKAFLRLHWMLADFLFRTVIIFTPLQKPNQNVKHWCSDFGKAAVKKRRRKKVNSHHSCRGKNWRWTDKKNVICYTQEMCMECDNYMIVQLWCISGWHGCSPCDMGANSWKIMESWWRTNGTPSERRGLKWSPRIGLTLEVWVSCCRREQRHQRH